MGFATGISYFLLAIVFIGMFVGMTVVLQDRVVDTAEGFEATLNAKKQQKHATINATAVNVSGTLRVIVRNSGSALLVPNKTDLYVHGAFIPRGLVNRALAPALNIRNKLYWDPGEILILNLTTPFTCGGQVRVVNEFGFSNTTYIMCP